jgi:predicted alpha/beta superfamily hydrolase
MTRTWVSPAICTALALALVASHAVQAQTVAPAPPQPATVAASQQIVFTSAVDGRRYRLQIAMPLAPPRPGGFPVLYILDGDAYFSTYASAARLRAALGGELEPVIVVGIGYPEADTDMMAVQRLRFFELTPTKPDAAEQALDERMLGAKVEYGGADTFFRVLQTEIRPRVAALAPVAPGRDILFGHSLGGLFVLHTLFEHPEAFKTWLALSPSIWWDHRAVLRGEGAFEKEVAGGKIAPRVFIGVGGREQTPPAVAPPGMTPEEVHREVAEAAMIDNARDLAARLKATAGAPGWTVDFKVFEARSHMAAPWAAADDLLDFALAVKPPS